ncbi:hypothetical protein JW977_01190 [Candidatus Falkowbacteria bacterium]|nr:hypothetical protein [Candidatus Falkowbacteria bacterium]
MKSIKFFLVFSLAVILLTACDLKVNINSDGNLNKLPEVSVNATDNTDESVNTNTAVIIVPEIVSTTEGAISQIKNATDSSVLIENIKDLCWQDMKLFAKPSSELLILTPLNPGSDKPLSDLYNLNLVKKTCVKSSASDELTDFGARVLSPNQTKLALALETNEAKILKLIDLVAGTSKVIVTLPEGETLNGGYGALSNHFDIKWLDDETIQYTVFKDTVSNYDIKAPNGIEDVLQVRVVKIE